MSKLKGNKQRLRGCYPSPVTFFSLQRAPLFAVEGVALFDTYNEVIAFHKTIGSTVTQISFYREDMESTHLLLLFTFLHTTLPLFVTSGFLPF